MNLDVVLIVHARVLKTLPDEVNITVDRKYNYFYLKYLIDQIF